MKKLLTAREEAIMQIMWNLKKALIREVREELPEPRPPYTTVASIVRKLTDEGHLGFNAFGNTYQYYPILKKNSYRKQVFKSMLKDYFGSSPEQVISYFIKEEKVNPEELQQWFDNIKKDKS